MNVKKIAVILIMKNFKVFKYLFHRHFFTSAVAVCENTMKKRVNIINKAAKLKLIIKRCYKIIILEKIRKTLILVDKANTNVIIE